MKRQIPKYWYRRFNKYKGGFEKGFNAKDYTIDKSIILEELQSKPVDYQAKVNRLIDMILDYPKVDPITELQPSTYSYTGFDVPQITHLVLKELNRDYFEVWSKDIDYDNRLGYIIWKFDLETKKPKKVITVFNISEHISHKLLDIMHFSDYFLEDSQRAFSTTERLSAKDTWLKEHSHLPKRVQEYIMPIFLKDEEVSPLSKETLEAMDRAQKYNYSDKKPIKVMPPIDRSELLRNNIQGTLIY